MWRIWNKLFGREYILLKGKFVMAVSIESDTELTFLRFPIFAYNPRNSDGEAKYTIPLTPRITKWWADNKIPFNVRSK